MHRILIIDDEDDIREVAALSLETVAGWEVMVASSGAQGLIRASSYQPDAILLDVMMPGMDGPATFRELRKNPATAHMFIVNPLHGGLSGLFASHPSTEERIARLRELAGQPATTPGPWA